MIEHTDAYYYNTDDPDFEPYVIHNDLLINGEYALEADDESWVLRTITDQHNRMPAINLATCRRLEIMTDINPEIIDFGMPFIDVIKQLAK